MSNIKFEVDQKNIETETESGCWSYAWKMLKEGKKVKLPSWDGYWQLECGEIAMHLKDGRVVNIRNTDNIVFTFDNIAKCGWIVVE